MSKKTKMIATTQEIRLLVKSIYDEQQLRIQMGNRIVANFNSKLGQAPSEKMQDEDNEKLIKTLKEEYKRITDAYINEKISIDDAIKNENGVISNSFEAKLIEHYLQKVANEDDMIKTLTTIVKNHPLWDKFFNEVKGCGPLMTAICISELDAYKARHISSFWKYAGLDVAKDGKGRSMHKDHLETVEYTSKDGAIKDKKSITYNPFLKTKLMGVLAPCMIKARSQYTKAYYDYKERQINKYSEITGYDKNGNPKRDYNKGITLGHIEMRSRRYMIKQFLADYWVIAREHEGLPVTNRYEVDKLGMNPHGFNYTEDAI